MLLPKTVSTSPWRDMDSTTLIFVSVYAFWASANSRASSSIFLRSLRSFSVSPRFDEEKDAVVGEERPLPVLVPFLERCASSITIFRSPSSCVSKVRWAWDCDWAMLSFRASIWDLSSRFWVFSLWRLISNFLSSFLWSSAVISANRDEDFLKLLAALFDEVLDTLEELLELASSSLGRVGEERGEDRGDVDADLVNDPPNVSFSSRTRSFNMALASLFAFHFASNSSTSRVLAAKSLRNADSSFSCSSTSVRD
mmetsp:Transcript_30981/g.52950  ORF Transcript_30981/g.52950 Transcript_30981/m.52950 type:complete len:254 (-) Transcript_30981:234-995(-)